jgi:hypothetical protein
MICASTTSSASCSGGNWTAVARLRCRHLAHLAGPAYLARARLAGGALVQQPAPQRHLLPLQPYRRHLHLLFPVDRVECRQPEAPPTNPDPTIRRPALTTPPQRLGSCSGIVIRLIEVSSSSYCRSNRRCHALPLAGRAGIHPPPSARRYADSRKCFTESGQVWMTMKKCSGGNFPISATASSPARRRQRHPPSGCRVNRKGNPVAVGVTMIWVLTVLHQVGMHR